MENLGGYRLHLPRGQKVGIGAYTAAIPPPWLRHHTTAQRKRAIRFKGGAIQNETKQYQGLLEEDEEQNATRAARATIEVGIQSDGTEHNDNGRARPRGGQSAEKKKPKAGE